MEYLTKGLAFNQCIIFITFDNKLEISSCVVIFIKEIPGKGRVVWIEWAYSNGKDLRNRLCQKTTYPHQAARRVRSPRYRLQRR